MVDSWSLTEPIRNFFGWRTEFCKITSTLGKVVPKSYRQDVNLRSSSDDISEIVGYYIGGLFQFYQQSSDEIIPDVNIYYMVYV